MSSPNHVIEPGVVDNEVPDRNTLWVGEPDDRASPRIEALRTALEGGRHRLAGDDRHPLRDLAQADGQPHRLDGLPGHRAARHVQKTPLVNRLSRRAHAEALAVAAAHGVVLDDHPDQRYGPKRVYTNHRPSILQDYDLGRPMEIESIVRAPVAFARSAGIDTPTLDAIESICVALAHAKGLYAP